MNFAVAWRPRSLAAWICDHLLPHAAQIKVAHPLMLRAIAAAKKKTDRIDAGKLADCLRCDFLPECHRMPAEFWDSRRTLRYRHLLVNRVSGLLMETGVKSRLLPRSLYNALVSELMKVRIPKP